MTDEGIPVYETYNNHVGTFYAPYRDEIEGLKIEMNHAVFTKERAEKLLEIEWMYRDLQK